jgi:outer membrane protein assembly factor BamB
VTLRPAVLALLWLAGCSGPRISATPSGDELTGTWVGQVSHQGESSRLILRIEKSADELQCRWSTPAVDLWDLPIGAARVQGSEVRVGPLALVYDRGAQTLSGTLPPALVPVYAMHIEFHRSPPVPRTPRLVPPATSVQPVWTFDAGAPIWADIAYAGGMVLAGADDGSLHAVAARTGKAVWSFRAGGAIRARPLVLDNQVLVPADDGFLYAVDAGNGRQRWRARVEAKPFVRLPLSDPGSRYEIRASGVATDGQRLYIGTHDGRMLAFGRDGSGPAWEFRAGDSVIATPLVASGRVWFGSFDGNVYALEADSGALLWKHDTGAPVTTTPAIHGGRVIVGSRSYDVLALEAKTGNPAWTRYVWFSWVESAATIFDDMVYIGSSDAAKLFAFDAGSGRRSWDVDVGGSAWGEPAVTAERVFAGAVGALHYLLPHRASAFALDRRTGTAIWRYPVEPPAGAAAGLVAYGFAGSPALGEGLAYFGGLDGHLHAFAQ